MRAPQNEAAGTSGQSFVKGEFEELGWGAVPNPEHDLGTDLWLMARDKNRFDLGALVGAQVKTGESYFKSAKKDDESGDVVGWWYAEEDDSHFDYWSEHTTPHILVLRDATAKTSYWVHVTSNSIQSTGKGNKILVPASQRVEEGSRDALTSVATSPAKAVSLDGSAWGAIWKVSQSDRLRYALMAPRLVAPHPNRGEVLPDATEAIAMLMQGRFSNLRNVASPGKRKDTEGVADLDSYLWDLFDAMWNWAVSGDLASLGNLPESADDRHLAATAVVQAAALMEHGQPEAALAAVRAVRSREGLGTVDLAWLRSHESRCLVELGHLEEARDLALEVQKLRAVAPSDPTATALVAVSTILVFDMSGFGIRDVGELIQSIDTSTRWWRSQTIASGLEKHFNEQFNGWGRDSSVTWAAADTVWTSIRSATLLAGLGADQGGWRHTMSLLARRELMKATSTNTEVILESLTDLLRAGAKKELVLATRKLGDDGPAEPLVALTARLDLGSTPRSCLQSALAFLRYAGDFADTANADRHAAWLVSSLGNPDELRERLKPMFLIEVSLLEALGGLMRSISPPMRRQVIDHLLSLPVIEDQSLAGGYGRIIALVGEDDWSDDDLSRLSARSDDNWELQDDIDGVLAASDPDFRIGLQEKIRLGDLTALGNFGRVTELPEDVARDAITHLVSRIETQIAQARSRMYSFGGPELGEALVVLNAWHLNVADWDTVWTLLSEPKSHPSHILGTLRILGRVAKQLPAPERMRLEPILEGIARRPAYERDTAFIPSNASPQSAAKLALFQFFPEKLTDLTMQGLLSGTPGDREVAANCAGDRRANGDQNLLVSLVRDSEPQVRTAAIVGLAKWLAGEEDNAELSARVQALVEAGGPLTAKHVTAYLLDMPSNNLQRALLRSLVDHPSALVRARVAAGLSD
ncbi:DUF4365 domain-containing protein [Aestuariimicrobium ganziense]|uniref:DUF4365 domain-containing protein n=1 Tax=Aestuariimicrobium ganziense TaxID=2773677 RepID=UPI00194110B2|nr:DUF4365 domain-containing protein [Aestuariimicrobium ganziense]